MHGVWSRPHTRAAVRTDDRCVCCLAQRAAGATPLLGPGGARVLLGSALLSAQMVQVRCWALFAS